MENAKFIQVMTTSDSRQVAEKIADTLVAQKLAACVQITSPVRSLYRWKGKVEKAKEYICFIKTRRKFFKKVETVIKKLHNYEVPEIIASEIIDANPDYIGWLDKELK